MAILIVCLLSESAAGAVGRRRLRVTGCYSSRSRPALKPCVSGGTPPFGAMTASIALRSRVIAARQDAGIGSDVRKPSSGRTAR
jgi:hypothetical protein